MLKLDSTPLVGLMTVQSEPFVDSRGAFYRCFCDQELTSVFGERAIRQINHSQTQQVGAVRGMHFQQPPHAEMKLVRCLQGRVWDVAVDLRHDSPTFLQWHAVELSSSNRMMLLIPEGFAHGFQVLEPSSELLYLHTAPYTKSAEGGIKFDDPRVAIDWPLPPVDLSARDQSFDWINDQFAGM